MKNGQIYYINFSGNKGSEINNIHLGIIFTIPKVTNMVFCIPLTSPKSKHFKNEEAFKNRNHLYLKYQNLVYINQTDSIALLDQLRSISVQRLLKTFNNIILNDENINLLIIKVSKYLKHVLQKQKSLKKIYKLKKFFSHI